MKVYALPSEVPAPEVDYMNYDHKRVEAQETQHQRALKAHFEALGYTGKNTGRILRVGHADGYAQYMYFDGPGGRAAGLVCLPYGDAWDSPMVRGLNKSYVLKMIDAEERRAAHFAQRDAARQAQTS